MSRIYLSPPDVGEEERALLLDAFDSNWIAPLGPHVDAFELEFAERVGTPALALSSGTAALHLALLVSGTGPGDDVLVPTLTFAATANAVVYLGARPVFVDSDTRSWALDPGLVGEELERRAAAGKLPSAVVAVDLYGQTADYDRLLDECRRFDVPLIEDAAEALGATYKGRPAGSLADLAAFSFNGNKIITTSGGGMLVSQRAEWLARARHLSTQARRPAAHYEHDEVGYNYRLSNLLAAVGRGQLRSLDAKVARRREVNTLYRKALGDLPGVEFMPVASYGNPSCWLTCITIAPEAFGASRDDVRFHLEALDIEARPTWKPMHLQPAFDGCAAVGGSVAEDVFTDGLCLPSGSSLSDGDVERVVDGVRSTMAQRLRLSPPEAPR